MVVPPNIVIEKHKVFPQTYMEMTIMAKVLDLINMMEHTNIVTFNTINGLPLQEMEVDGTTYWVRPFSAYNWEVVLDGEKVCINPMNYNGNLRTIEFKLNIETMEKCDFWLFFTFDEAIIYESVTGQWLGQLTEILDPRDIAERLADMKARGEI